MSPKRSKDWPVLQETIHAYCPGGSSTVVYACYFTFQDWGLSGSVENPRGWAVSACMSSSDLVSLPVLRRDVPAEASGAGIGPDLEAAMPVVCKIHHCGGCPFVWVPDLATLARMDGHWRVMESSSNSLPVTA